MSDDATHELPCPACHRPNEPPFLFCTDCGHPLLHLGKWRITINLSLAFSIFLSTYLLRDYVGPWVVWDWPFYLFFTFVVAQIAFWMVRGVPGQTFMLIRWGAPALIAFLAYFEYRHRVGEGIFSYAVAELPALAHDFPLIFYPALAALLAVIFVPMLFRWARLYGWVNSYRILAMTIILLSLAIVGLFRLADWILERNLFPAWSRGLEELASQRPVYQLVLGETAFHLTRLLIFEIFVTAMIKGYAVTRKVRFKAPAARPGESGFARALTGLALQLRRLMLTLENTLRTIGASLALLAVDLGRVALRTLNEIFLPLVAVVGGGWLLYALTGFARRYIEEGDEWAGIGMAGALVALLVALIVFLGCKTPLRWGRLIGNQGQLLGWMLPNVMVLFLLVSLSLVGMARFFNDPDDPRLPYRIGPVTLGIGGLLILMTLIVLARKWAQIAPAVATETIEDEEPIDVVPEKPKPPRKTLRERVEGVGWAGKIVDRAGQVGTIARGAGKEMKDRIKGKPAIVDRLEEMARRKREKEGQLVSLEAMKGSLDPETLQQLRLQYRSELPRLVKELEQLKLEVAQRLAERLTEQRELAEQVQRAHNRHAEVARLLEAKVIDEATARRQRRELETQIEVLEAKAKGCEQMIGFLKPALEQSGFMQNE
jgi:hypothetical protein